MKNGCSIAVVIPALNEEKAIAKVIGDIPSYVDRIVVADNGSTDKTCEAAAAAGAHLVTEPARGYGAACLRGLMEVRDRDIIVFLDGDYADRPAQMDRLVDPIIAGQSEMVIGSRVLGEPDPGALTPQQRFGNWLACRLIDLIWGVKFTDLGPFRAIRRSTLDELKMQDRDYGWTVEMQIKAARAGLACDEVPVSYHRRIGISKVSGTVKGTILAGSKILGLIAWYGLRRIQPSPSSKK